MKRYATEFIGTFFLVFTIGMVSVTGSAGAPLAIGATLMVMVYMGGHVSGAHYNPAVSLAILQRGAMEKSDFVPYLAAQLLGATVASAVVVVLTGSSFAPAPSTGGLQAVVAEALVTFALALVVLNVATAESTKGNSYYGLAIGFTVLAGAASVGNFSGGAFNPAVGIGPILVDTISGGDSIADVWIYVLGPFAGAAAAAPVFKLQTAA
ncbi:MAG: porin [Gemmatimonadetes bacterium]|nr:porin [Gemmatimonadota bacterium]